MVKRTPDRKSRVKAKAVSNLVEARVGNETPPRPLTLNDWLERADARLCDAGIDDPRQDLRLLVGQVTGMTHADMITGGARQLTARQLQKLDEMVSRRVAREPVSRILGQREFYGRSFAITQATLDPRPDSETIIDAVLLQLDADGARDKPLHILDVGTGSGCLLLTLLAELPNATGLGTDIVPAALGVAQANAVSLGVGKRATFSENDSLEGINETFDILVSNPPYIRSHDIAALAPEVRSYDPQSALDGGHDGLDVYRAIKDRITAVIPNGWVFFEVGFDQAEMVKDLLLEANAMIDPESCHILPDLAGHDRVVKARTN